MAHCIGRVGHFDTLEEIGSQFISSLSDEMNDQKCRPPVHGSHPMAQSTGPRIRASGAGRSRLHLLRIVEIRAGWIASILSESWGPFVVGVLGVFVIGVGLYEFKKAVKLGFLENARTVSMSREERTTLAQVDRIGLSARGVVFPIIGYYLLKAAVSANPSTAKGVGGTLNQLPRADPGCWPSSRLAWRRTAFCNFASSVTAE